MAAQLSQEQVVELKQSFNEFDVDGGGTITTRELGYAMRAMGMNPTENELLELIHEVFADDEDINVTNTCQYDTDGSGQIEFPVFCNMMSHKMSDNDDEEMVRLAFRALDKDGSGSITHYRRVQAFNDTYR